MKNLIAVLSILALVGLSVGEVNAQSIEGQSSFDTRTLFSDPAPQFIAADKGQGKRIYFEDPSPQFINKDGRREGKKRLVFTDPSPQHLEEESRQKANGSGKK